GASCRPAGPRVDANQTVTLPRPGRLVASGPVASGVVLLVPVVVSVVAEAGRVPAGVQQAQSGQVLYFQDDQDQRGGGDREQWVSLTGRGTHHGGTEDRRGGRHAVQDPARADARPEHQRGADEPDPGGGAGQDA